MTVTFRALGLGSRVFGAIETNLFRLDILLLKDLIN
jgi:hypothetical protein